MDTSRMNDAFDRLYNRKRFGIKFGLDVELALLRLMGNPQERYPAVHIAGTNGKGSVTALLDAMLSQAGYRTGRYISPHLVRFNERFCVNGRPIPDDALLAAVARQDALIARVTEETGQEPTFFECATAIALDYFAEQKVDIAILETGMGGRLDATNVVTPLLSVITRIGIEHTAYLGADIQSIAAEKAGIIKPGRPVVLGQMGDEAARVVRDAAAAKLCLLVDAAQTVSINVISRDLSGQTVVVETGESSYGRVRLPLAGRHQLENLATAVAAAETLRSVCGLELDDAAVKKGVAATSWPGRFQLVRADPPVILDGAHNPDAGRALAAALREHAGKRRVGLVVGMCGDKEAMGFLRPFAGLAERIWLVPIRDERSIPMDRLRAAADAIKWRVTELTLKDALTESVRWAAAEGGMVCIAGSLFLVGEVLETLEV